MTKGQEAIKRLRQETCPATYMPDFDKEECLQVVEKELKVLQLLKEAYNMRVFYVGTNTISYTKKEIEYTISDGEDWNYRNKPFGSNLC